MRAEVPGSSTMTLACLATSSADFRDLVKAIERIPSPAKVARRRADSQLDDARDADEALGKVARVADGRGGEDEPRFRSVVAGDPPEPPQDAAHVAPEHPSQRVGLVDHDVGEV